MSFASVEFIIFFVVVIVITAILQNLNSDNPKHIFLLGSSYFFYGYWDWRFCFLLLFVTTSSFYAAKAAKSIVRLGAGVCIPLIVLGFFKYFNFFLESASVALGKDLGILEIILPVGISFYTFQALSYVIDVHRGTLSVENSFIKLALYLSFFPQLVAGPIVRASDFLPQLGEDNRRVTIGNLKMGIQLVAFGLFKKIVIADHISVFVDDVYAAPVAFNWQTLLLAVLAYSVQIYFDFSGYSDIAIGCAKCLGYDFIRNFNLPYISQSVTEFWRRWHISLSSWLKEYLYISLGGNRKGENRRYINLMITMILGGLWHGANWTFVFWGFLHGIALCIDKSLGKRNSDKVIVKCLNVVLTYLFVSFVWIFFRAESFDVAWKIIYGIFTLQAGILQPFFWAFVGIGVLALGTISAILKSNKNKETVINGYYPLLNLDSILGLTLFFVFCGLTLCLAFTGEKPFVYFQF